jgi:hypothetical protein
MRIAVGFDRSFKAMTPGLIQAAIVFGALKANGTG